jgi:DNA polymerase-3 subunit epsilon
LETIVILGLDLETTGLSCEEDRIIELCFGLYSDECELIRNVTMRFNPCRPIDPKAQAVHGISNADLMDCPKFSERAEVLNNILGKAKLIVIHNAKFDAPFLKAEFERCGLQAPETPVYCTMSESRWATPDGKWPKLGELCFACGVTYNPEEAHAAEYDVNKMMECFADFTKKGFFSGNTTAFNKVQSFARKR